MPTFSQYLQQHSQQYGIAPELTSTVESIVAACVEISRNVRLGALSGVLGEAGTGNIQGEAQKKLDVIANQILMDTLRKNPNVAGLAIEEEDDFVAAA